MRRLWLEYAVAATLLASFLTVPLPIPHTALGSAWAALVVAHVVRWRRVYRSVLRRGPHPRSVATTTLIGTAVVVTVSGFAQWAGSAAAIPWHAASSTLLLLLAAGHATRRLRRRFSARRARADARREPAVAVGRDRSC